MPTLLPCHAAVLALSCLLPLAVFAQPVADADGADAAAGTSGAAEPAAGSGLRYALGLAVIDSPTYAGASGREVKLRPLWSVRYGRFRLSGARSSGLLTAPSTEKGSGAHADLIDSDRLKLGLGLRFDNGRSPGDDPTLAGLPKIRSTLRARLNGEVALGGGFITSLSYSADLLGRGGGGQVGWGLGYRWSPWTAATASVGVGATWADRRYMQTYFGIAPAVAQQTGRVAFSPGAGLVDLNAGAVLRVPITGQWSVTGGLALSDLRGQAAASPLTGRAFGATAMVAVAWASR